MNLPRTASFALLVLLLGCGGTRAAPVANGGFEDAGLADWEATGAVAASDASPHAGRFCAGGDADAKGWTISQSVPGLAKGRTYRVDAWLRATGAASIALWAQVKGPKDAQRVTVWEDLPAEWTPVSAYVTATREDKLTLRFAASSEDAERASVWIDDVSLSEATLPAATQVEPGLGFDDEPSMARAADGSVYVAWVSWRDGADSLQVARYAAKRGGTFEKLAAWQVEGGPGTNVRVPPLYVWPHDTVVAVEYAVERGGTEDGVIARITKSGLDGNEPGGRGGWWWDDQRVSATLRAAGTYDSYCLAMARTSPEGNVDVGWNTELRIHDARRAHAADWGLNQVTHAPTIDRNPVLVARGPDLWLLYENVETPGYRVDFETARHVVVAKIDGDRLVAPRNYMATSPLWAGAESPAAAFDDKGRLWVAYRKPRLPTAGWDVYLTGWTGSAWVPPIPVSSQKGMNRRPSLVIDGNRAIVCYQADDLPSGWSEVDRTKDAKSGVYLASVELPDVPATPHELEPLVENQAPWEAAKIRKQFGDDAPVRRDTEVGGQKMSLLFGDLHAHSDASVCDRLRNGSADDVYAMQRDFLHLDFACLTDHAENMNPYLWNRQAKLARANDVPGRFTTFLGFEWTSGYDGTKPEGFFGHRNVILGDLRFPRWWSPRDHQTPAELWSELRAAKADFVTIPHQLADTGNVPTDWTFTDEVAQPVAEIFQVRGSYEAPGAPRVGKKATASADHFLQGALKAGVVVGVIASPDHGGGLGKACVWAKENSRAAILDALRARRCYGTTGARIALEVRVAGHFMGEKTNDGATGPVVIEVKAACPGDVAKVSICRGGEWIHAETPPAREFAVRFTDDKAPAGPKWYYVRVEQADGEIAWSSPVWLGR